MKNVLAASGPRRLVLATRDMADAVVVSPNGIGMHHHGHDRHHGDEGMLRMQGHGGHDVDDHADRDHEKPTPNKMG